MKEKTKVVSYIYRNSKTEVLVFTHRDFPEAGIQVAGGTVEPGEDFKVALAREVLEESGLEIGSECFHPIGQTSYLRKDRPEVNLRHYFEMESSGLLDSWTHTVVSTGEDNGLLFDFFWLNTKEAREQLTGDFGELLPG